MSLPPTDGHRYLVDFARAYADEVTVVVCSLPSEPIPGALRHAWMTELSPGCRVVHLDREMPQEPPDHPDFWELWREALLAYGRPDVLFASEAYGARLARELGASFVPVDIARELVPISGTEVRANPLAAWPYLPPCVRAHVARRVCLHGPESTGKTTLARDLARHFDTVWVHEYARPLLDLQGGVCTLDDIQRIARGQAASEDAMARRANKVLFTDTDHVTTCIWSEVLFGEVPEIALEEAAQRTYDLTLLLDVDVPWVAGPQRYLPHEREAFFERCRRELEARDRPYVVIRGSWEERFARAVAAVDEMLG